MQKSYIADGNELLSIHSFAQQSHKSSNNIYPQEHFIMFGNTYFTRVKRSDNIKMAAIAQFLKNNDLSVDTTVEVFITVMRDDRLIACGGIAGNIIKCVAICESVRGEGLALTLATELINLAYERHCTHLFIYTKTEYEALFKQCGFSTLTSVPGIMVLMENSTTRLKRYAESLSKQRHYGQKSAAS